MNRLFTWDVEICVVQLLTAGLATTRQNIAHAPYPNGHDGVPHDPTLPGGPAGGFASSDPETSTHWLWLGLPYTHLQKGAKKSRDLGGT
jgi:hypothetical protein